MTDAVRTLDLAKSFGSAVALAGMTLTMPRGEVLGFLGPNGSGKTTALKLLLGLTRPSGGEAWVLGAPAGDRAVRRRVGYLPELFRYQSWLRAGEVLALHCSLAGIPPGGRAGQIASALRRVGLEARAESRVGTFSKGMQQRLGLAVALLGDPELVFLDEPTSALDPVGRHDVREVIRDLRSRGTSVFLNSHLLTEVEHVCDRAAFISGGRVVASGTLAEMLGGGGGVRMRVTGLGGDGLAALGRFGDVAGEDGGGWTVIRGLAEERIPDAVAEAVRLGGRVYAVERLAGSLEDRFLELVAGADGSAPPR